MLDREQLGSLEQGSREAQDLQTIEKILSREGVRDVITRFGEQFKAERGYSILYGITQSGLVVGVREGVTKNVFKPGYFKAWALNAALPAEQIEQEMIQVDLSCDAVDRLGDGGTTEFPGIRISGILSQLIGRTDEEIIAAFPKNPGMVSYVRFTERTGGFYYPSPFRRGRAFPLVGGNILYPLNK